MPSHHIIEGLNTKAKEPKPSTPLQHQLARTRELDLANAEASNAALLAHLNPEKVPQAEEPVAVADNVGGNPFEAPDDLYQHQAEDEEDEPDLNQSMPGPAPPLVVDN
ncbi:hypothetical protein DFH28DRAFT_1125339 [Melampsora americana]|nr:hypothetical protein DFH28DRAFT_1125339 [Melampsora americana]